MKPSDRSRFEALLAWSQQHGAHLHPSLEIYHDDITQCSLRVRPSAEHDLEPGSIAVTCPLTTTLSYLNALVDGPITLTTPPSPSPPARRPTFPPHFMQTIPPHIIGRFFLISEYLKGGASFWAPYIATLPQPTQVAAWALPPFWPADDAAFLAGTNAHAAIDEILANVRREFKLARRALREAAFPGWQDYSQMLYKWAFCVFASRSFRPSLVLSEAAHRYISGVLLAEGCRVDDFSVLQPLFDIANHSATARYTWDVSASDEACKLVCGDAYRPGEQVFNNYGRDKTNSELLLAYGFVLPATEGLHNDYVHVRKRRQEEDHDDGEEDGGEGGGGSDKDKPQDFLISLRPVAHPSSLAGHSRLAVYTPSTALSTLPAFAHFEPALVDDLTWAVISSPEEKSALERWSQSRLGDGAGGESGDSESPAEVEELVSRVKGVLAGKLSFDLARLREVEEGDGGEDGEEGGLPPPEIGNQMLAMEYRMACGRVLCAAMEGLGVVVEGEDAAERDQ